VALQSPGWSTPYGSAAVYQDRVLYAPSPGAMTEVLAATELTDAGLANTSDHDPDFDGSQIVWRHSHSYFDDQNGTSTLMAITLAERQPREIFTGAGLGPPSLSQGRVALAATLATPGSVPTTSHLLLIDVGTGDKTDLTLAGVVESAPALDGDWLAYERRDALGGDAQVRALHLPALPEGGAYLELHVYNSAGSAQKLVAAVPAPLLPSGNLDILWRRIASPTLTVGAITRLDFTLRSSANQPLPVTVTASSTSNGVSVHLVDSGAATALAPGGTRDFFVELTPQVADASFALELRASGGGITSFFSVGGLQVGSPSPPQDFDLDLKSQVLQARSAVDDLIAVGDVLAQVRVMGELHSAGTWTLDAQASSSDWKVVWWTPMPPQLSATSADLTSGLAFRSAILLIEPAVTTPANATITVTAQQAGVAGARQIRYRVLSVN
jgi:hypothetical protein